MSQSIATVELSTPKPVRRGGRPPIERPDQVVGQHVRGRILKALSDTGALSFSDVLAITGTSSGGLSLHARKLEGFGYITIEKSFVGRIPQTTFRLTPAGREALEQHAARP